MIDISSINAVSGMLAAIGVIVRVVFAVLQLRDLVKTRHPFIVQRKLRLENKTWIFSRGFNGQKRSSSFFFLKA